MVCVPWGCVIFEASQTNGSIREPLFDTEISHSLTIKGVIVKGFKWIMLDKWCENKSRNLLI